MAEKVIVRLDTRKPLAGQFEAMDDDLYGRLLERLRDAGWWDGEDIQDELDQAATAAADWWLVAVELHRQAHPGDLPDPVACRSEPCRSMPLHMLANREPVCQTRP